MKKYKQEVVTNFVYDKTLCDICGRDILVNTGSIYGINDTISITYNHEEYTHGDGLVSYKKEYDVCAECFKKHITLLFREKPLHE